MAKFHRFKDPTYYGAGSFFPGASPLGPVYDRINVVSEGVGAGGSAPADDKKVGGVNANSYFFTFGEDVLSVALNRGLRALAENTDVLDDVLNTSRALPRYGTIVVAAPTNTVEIPSDAYLGPTGTVLNQVNLRRFLRLLTSDGDEVIDASSAARVELTSVTGFANSPADPFTVSDTEVTLSHTIPAGTYQVYYGARSSYAIAGIDGFYEESVLYAHRGSAKVQQVLIDLYGHPTAKPWSDTITNTNWLLATRGLQGTIDNVTDLAELLDANAAYGWPALQTSDTYGAGGLWQRLNFGAVGVSRLSLVNMGWTGDGLSAIWGAYIDDINIGNASAYNPMAASRGFVSVGHYRGSTDNGTLSGSAKAPALAHFAAYASLDDQFSDSTKAMTSIALPASVLVFRTGGIDTVELQTAGDFFSQVISAVRRSSLVIDHTLLEIEWDDTSEPGAGVRRHTYVVSSISTTDDQRVTVRAAGGASNSANFPVAPAAGTLRRVLTPTFQVLDGHHELLAKMGSLPLSDGRSQGPLFVLDLPENSSFAGDKVTRHKGSYFGASESSSTSVAIAFGGYVIDINAAGGVVNRLGFLFGDGSAQFQKMTALGISSSRRNVPILDATVSVTAVGDYALDVSGNASQNDRIRVDIDSAGAVRFIGIQVTDLLTSDDDGREIEIVFVHKANAARVENDSVWAASNVVFENPADGWLSNAANSVDIFKGRVLTISGTTRLFITSVKRFGY